MQAVAYEACRLFRDCLTTPQHASTFDSILADTLRKHWGTAVDASGALFTTAGAVSTASGQLFLSQPTHVMLAALACALRICGLRIAQLHLQHMHTRWYCKAMLSYDMLHLTKIG